MQKRTWMWVFSIVLLITVSGCGWLDQATETAAENGDDLQEYGLNLHDFSYTNQFNEVVTNQDLEGEYTLVNMIFTRCPTVCNLMTPNMTQLQTDLAMEDIDVNLVSFTVDPEYDTPERLKDYGDQYEADYSNWNFLTGYSYGDVEEFATSTFNSTVVPATDEEDIVHSTDIFLVDDTGQVIQRYDGLDVNTDPILEDLRALTGNE
ncbi:protein SCO1/2 [Geomicrobium halophilum]|uniref:Protein SCO1/2 n=1 Tax=Geomicrobium halophilum TaxID=549000 RepID=A0A841PQC3_9BACL|nr:SCO family protein [Geomicrobium halophilum]MBB6448511.1 protein SCO1/2 [Geomicrobium halophilum]